MSELGINRRALVTLLLSLSLGLLTTGLLLGTLQTGAAATAAGEWARRGGTYTQTLPIVKVPLTLDPVVLTCNSNDWQLIWELTGNADYYEVQESHAPDFSNPATYSTTNTFFDFNHPAGIDNIYYYRVRSMASGVPGQWSNSQRVVGAYLDNFDNAGSGWPTGDMGSAIHSYVNGKYAIETLFAGWLNGTLAPDANRVDYIVSGAMNFDPSLPTNGTYGLVFGANANASHYYFVAVYPSFGDFRVWRWDGDLHAISPFTINPAINSGSGVNMLEVARIGNNIKVTINGVNGGTWSDNTVTGGTRAGIMVSPQSAFPNIQARFDNVGVRFCDNINEARDGTTDRPVQVAPGPRLAVPFSIPVDIHQRP